MKRLVIGVLCVVLAHIAIGAAPATAAGPAFQYAFGSKSTDVCTTLCGAGELGSRSGNLRYPWHAAVSGGRA